MISSLQLETNELIPPPPLATVKGQVILDLPKDLYIPPDAMKVFLETFAGPLDLLLYLIRKQNIDILDIPIADVTKQYMEYINLMEGLTLELAAEYLVMAAILAEIKSRMLLPRVIEAEATEEDPRAELVRRLQEYERYKEAAAKLDQLPREERDFHQVKVESVLPQIVKPLPQVSIQDLVLALQEVMKRVVLNKKHQVQLDSLSVREKMTHILERLKQEEHLTFTSLFNIEEGRFGVVVTFLGMLELLKENLIDFVQAASFAPIYLKLK